MGRRGRPAPPAAAASAVRLVVVAVAAAAVAAPPGGWWGAAVAAAVGHPHPAHGRGVAGGAVAAAAAHGAGAPVRHGDRRGTQAPTTPGGEEVEEEEEEEAHGAPHGGASPGDHGSGHGHGGLGSSSSGGGGGGNGGGGGVHHGGGDEDGGVAPHRHAVGSGGGGDGGGGGGGGAGAPAPDSGSYFSYVRKAFHITDAEEGEAGPAVGGAGQGAAHHRPSGAGGGRRGSVSGPRGDGEEEGEEAGGGEGGDGAPSSAAGYGEVEQEGGPDGTPALSPAVKLVAGEAARAGAKKGAPPSAVPPVDEGGGDKPQGALAIGSDTVGVFHGLPPQPNQKADDVTRLSFMLWRVIKTYHIKSMVDVPCRAHGSWMPQMLARLDYDLPEFRYYCVDASPRVVKEAKAMVGDLVDGHFVVRDWGTRRLPSADLIFSWRGLDAAPAAHVHRLLSNIPASGAKYLLLGSADTHNEAHGGGKGAGAVGGAKRGASINFRKAPFRLPQHPMRVIKEVTLPTAAHSRSLLLYQVSELAASQPQEGEPAKTPAAAGRPARL